MDELSHRRIQDEELEAMKAIFGEDWVDIDPVKTAWGTKEAGGKKWKVKLKACDGQVGITLCGKMIKHYPAVPPTLTVQDGIMLNAQQVKDLGKSVQTKAKELVGSEMIFDLTTFVQECLEANHLPLPISHQVPTLMEQKVQRDASLLEVQLSEARKREAAERSRLEEQEMLLSEQIKAEMTERLEMGLKMDEERKLGEGLGRAKWKGKNILPRGGLPNEIITFQQNTGGGEGIRSHHTHGHGMIYNTWKVVGLGKQEQLWTSYDVEAITGDSDHLESVPLAVTASSSSALSNRHHSNLARLLVIDFSTQYYNTPLGQRKILSFISSVERVIPVKHKHLLATYAVERQDTETWSRVLILVERLGEGMKVDNWLMVCGRFGEEMAKAYMQQTLQAIEHLHLQDLAHSDINLDTIYIASDDKKAISKLCYPSYGSVLLSMNRSNPFVAWTGDEISDPWLAPEERDISMSNPDDQAAKDIWQIARVFIQFLWGKETLAQHSSLRSISDADKDGEINPYIMDLLKAMMARTQKKRISASDAIIKLSHIAHEGRTSSNAVTIGSTASRSTPVQSFFRSPVTARGFIHTNGHHPDQPAPLSRYRTDFEEVEWIGGGGFGQVVKARHKLEKQYYAIKKILLSERDDLSKVYRETEALARLAHPHIVRYISSWVESADEEQANSDDDTSQTATTTEGENTTTSDDEDEDEDDIFGPPDFDDVPYHNNEHSKSFPRIRFANSSSGDSDEDDEDESSLMASRSAQPNLRAGKPPLFTRTSSTNSRRTKRVLYIQMEYIENQTLKEAIAQGLSAMEYWKTLRQLLDALAYLAKVGIRHRDLKPANVARDASLDVKVLDFGLSVADTSNTALTKFIPSAVFADGDMTSQVGTSLYISPEVLAGRNYDAKVDIYSLGVIFFEMCAGPFPTNMERIEAIRGIRSKDVVFPADWPRLERPNETSIIQWMLQHDPSQRPEAAEVLASSLLPEGREEGYYAEAIRKITQPGSTHFPQLLERLFKPDQGPVANPTTLEYTYDAIATPAHDTQAWSRVVRERLIALFTRHGAIELNVPLLTPITSATATHDGKHLVKAAKLLDSQGHLVRLPSDGTVQFARYTSRKGIERMKRYSFGTRYAETTGQPRALGEVNFDIVTSISTEAMQGELLSVVDKIIGEFRGLSAYEYEFHISHGFLVELLLGKVPLEQRELVVSACNEAWLGTTLGHAKIDLSAANLPKPVVDALQHCMVIDEWQVVRQRMLSVFPSEQVAIGRAFNDIENTISFAKVLGITRAIKVKPTSFKSHEYYRQGFFFETVRRGKRDIIAAGGRYDSLLRHFRMPKASGVSWEMHAAGVSIAMDRLTYHVAKYESNIASKLIAKENDTERSFGLWSPSRCDVYVASFGNDQIGLRLEVVGELWKAQVSADVQYDMNTMESVVADCLQQNILFIAIPRPNRASVKIKSVLRRTEEEVPRSEFISYLRHAISEQRRVDLAVAGLDSNHFLSNRIGLVGDKVGAIPIVENGGREGERDVRLILRNDEEKKSKRQTKSIYYEKAYDFATSMKTQLPVFGIDATAATLAQLCLTPEWLVEDDTWKACLGLFPGDRHYAETIRGILRDFKYGQGNWNGNGTKERESVGMVFLYSLREGKASVLNLGGKS